MSSNDLSIWFSELELKALKACPDPSIQRVVRVIEDSMPHPIPLVGHIPNLEVCLIFLDRGHLLWMAECITCEAPVHSWCVDPDAPFLEVPELNGWQCIFCQEEEERDDNEHSDP